MLFLGGIELFLFINIPCYIPYTRSTQVIKEQTVYRLDCHIGIGADALAPKTIWNGTQLTGQVR